ncbi:VOC family protein [Pseudonocardia sp. CA-107938]|uniref:VOC family protein n=1 Tax=Pseudonocardia sp. CA-107938 TaxID=3240021 RepID=UPI003D8B64CC
MAIALDHAIVRTTDRHAGAAFLAELLGLIAGEPTGPFVPVDVNADTTLDFDDRVPVGAPGHWAFRVDDAVLDAALALLAERPGIPFGRGPGFGWDGQVDTADGARRLYVQDPDGHVYELFPARVP